MISFLFVLQFIAVAAHPPDSTYHKMGAPLTGRGAIQIWCLLNENTKKHEPSHIQKKQKKGSGKSKTEKVESNIPQKPRGRPRKYPLNESGNKLDPEMQRKPKGRPRKHPVKESANVLDSISEEVQPLAIQCLDSPSSLSIDVATSNICKHVCERDSGLEQEVAYSAGSTIQSVKKKNSNIQRKPRGRPRKDLVNEPAKVIDSIIEEVQPLAIQCLEHSHALRSVEKHAVLDQEVAGNTVSMNNSKSKIDSNIQQKSRETPRKGLVNDSANMINSITKEQSLAVQCLENSTTLLSTDMVTPSTHEHVSPKDSGLKQGSAEHTVVDHKSASPKLRRSEVCIRKNFQAPESALPLLMQDESGKVSFVHSQTTADPDFMMSKDNVIPFCSAKSARSVPKDVSLPRMVLCLAHNGKVAWDLKWRPSNVYDKQRMGYLAVLLGNGALEV